MPELVATTLDRLATQAALHSRGAAREPYISIGQLRDDVLRSELQGRRREDLWRRVRNVVEGNANIRAAVREGRGGDVARVWEWIGGISSVSDYRESNRQFPVSPDSGDISNERQNDQHQTEQQASGVGTSRAWNEGRPIY